MATPLDANWVRAHLPPRRADTHKGNYGTLAILAGSRRYAGAAVLAAAGALRAGAGLVRLGAIPFVCTAAAAQLPCCILEPLPETPGGGVAPGGTAQLLAQGQTALLAGCGLGNTPETAALVAEILDAAACPLVLDADALNALAASDALLNRLPTFAHPAVLTPHIGEMARLTGHSAAGVQAAQAETALALARQTNCVVVLKSHRTVVAAPAGECWENSTAGGPGLARGGSGDVLAGIIASLLAQGHPAHIAAAAGVWLHAAAGDEAAALHGQAGMSPADVPLALGSVWRALGR